MPIERHELTQKKEHIQQFCKEYISWFYKCSFIDETLFKLEVKVTIMEEERWRLGVSYHK